MKKKPVVKNPNQKPAPEESLISVCSAFSKTFRCDVIGVLSPDKQTLKDAMRLTEVVDEGGQKFPMIDNLRNIVALFDRDEKRIKIDLPIGDLILLKNVNQFYTNYASYTKRLYFTAMKIGTIDDLRKIKDNELDDNKDDVKDPSEVLDFDDDKTMDLIKQQ